MTDPGNEERSPLRTPWSRSDRAVPRVVLRPLQEFLQTQNAGGLVLLGAILVALIWANSPWSASYEQWWGTDATIRIGSRTVGGDLRYWVNDGLMTLFFLVVGLEIRRELTIGELREWRAAAMPVLAALGGMVVPAVLFLGLNAGHPTADGWGIPMATDIALALGVLTLAAAHAPSALKPFLLTLAIVDDIGAILVIAVFYASDIAWTSLALAVAFGVIIVLLQRFHVRHPLVYVLLGTLVWYETSASGIHPTIAGAALGLFTPSIRFERSSLARVEHLLLPWVTFVILPLFALANAGVTLSMDATGEALTGRLGVGIVIGLVAGKAAGVWGTARLAGAAGIARRPTGATWAHVGGVAVVAGVGFTVALFIAELAFEERPEFAEQAKIAILFASLVAGIIGFLLLRLLPNGRSDDLEAFPDPAGDLEGNE